MNAEKSMNEADIVNAYLHEILRKIAKKEEFVASDINVRNLNPDGSNYIAILSEVDIKGATKDGDKEVNLFVKSVLPNKENVEMLSFTDAYLKERYAYIEIANIYEELQEGAQIPPEKRYKFAKFYEESNSEISILENLSKKGFTTPNRFEVISLDYAELCIMQLAKFHAISHVIEKKLPKDFNDKIKVHKFGIEYNEQWDIFFDNSSKCTLNYLEGSAKEKLNQALPLLIKKLKTELTKNNSNNCLCHGDYRTSNIMQKIQNGKVTEVMPVDYQMINYGSPMPDFMFFIFGATDSEFRRNHLDHLKKLYFNTMADFLKYFSMDIKNIFSRNEFENSFKEHLYFGLYICIWHYYFHLADENDLPDFTKIGSLNFSTSNPRIKSRLQDAVNDFIDWGFL